MTRHSPGDLVSGKYRIERLIGDGGMGVVYEARHELLRTGVALKFLHADLAQRPGLAQRFLQEARVSATIQSPHVTRVTDVDTARDGSPYLVMELLSGQSLQALLDRHGKLPVAQAVDFSLQILAGLEAAHAMGVVHRDLKPDNVFVTPSTGGPLLKLIDFGIAKLRATNDYSRGLTRAGVIMGTPEYMAPEQLFSAETTDERADIYSLGVMLFEMLAGCRPADGEDAEAIIAAVRSGRTRRLSEVAPEVPSGLVALVEQAIRPDREQRFEKASTLRLALSAFAGPLSHAGQLAATSAPLVPMPVPEALGPLSQSTGVSTARVPKTLPPEAPPLSVSQLGAARTSVSDRPLPPAGPTGWIATTGTAMGGPSPIALASQTGAAYVGTGPPHYSVAPPLPARAPHQGRSGLWLAALGLTALGGAGAVGYAVYQSTGHAVVAPPMPQEVAPPAPATATAPTRTEISDVSSPRPVPTETPRVGTRPPIGGKPTETPPPAGGGGGAASGATTGGGAPPFQLPFPLPSGIQMPTALPSAIQLPPGITFPSGIPGLPQASPVPAPEPTAAPQTPPPEQPPPEAPTIKRRPSSKP